MLKEGENKTGYEIDTKMSQEISQQETSRGSAEVLNGPVHI